MVEAIPVAQQFEEPRTLNPAAPYGKRKRKPVGVQYLVESEADLGDEKVVLALWARPENSVRRIEQVGKGYEALKIKYAKLAERMEMGASAHFESDGEEEEEKKEGGSGSDAEGDAGDAETEARREEFEKKRKTKTKA